MKIFGSLTELISLVFRKNSQTITLRPNNATTYTAARTIDSPAQDANSVLVSRDSTDTLLNKTLTSPVINTPTGITKSDVGLGNVDNTSDATKNAAAVTLTNKTLTAPVINSPTGIVKGDVGLGNVDNTSDATKNAATVTLTNKTLTSPTINTPVQGSYEDFTEIATPGTPGAGVLRLYSKSDHKFYAKDPNGTETVIGSGSGSGINYILNPDFESGASTGWATYADAAATTPVDGTGGSPSSTFAATVTTPLRGTYSGLFTKGAANRQGEGFSYAFSIASADKSLPLQISWEGLASANYTGSASTEFLSVYVYDVTNSTLIIPSSIVVPQGSGKGKCNFNATTSASYRLIFHVAGTGTSAWTYEIDTVSVSPNLAVFGAATTDWISYTPTGSWTANTSYNGQYRRVGDTMELQVYITLTGAPTSANLTINMPTGFSIDSTKLASGTSTVNKVLGTGDGLNGGDYWMMQMSYNNSTSVAAFSIGTNVAAAYASNPVNATAPVTWANGNTIELNFIVPVVGWNSNIQIADRALEEYASNSSTSDAADTTSFVYGAAGSTTPGALTAERAKRVRFLSPIQITDTLILEFQSSSTGPWVELTGRDYNTGVSPSTRQNGIIYGMSIATNSINATDVDVKFGQYSEPSGTTYASAGSAWGTGNGRWRVRKVSAGSSVGFSSTVPDSQVRVDTGNGHGSTNTKIRRFTNFVTTGTAITGVDSATLGSTFTINRAGVYSISYTDEISASSSDVGLSLNSANLATSITSLTAAERLIQTSLATGNRTNCGVTIRCNVGDVIRAHTDGAPNDTTARCQFVITQVAAF